MASGIPPLLPASPPPMCKDDFNEEEIDINHYVNEDDDEFGDFSEASPSILSSNTSGINKTVVNPISCICDSNLGSSILEESHDSKIFLNPLPDEIVRDKPDKPKCIAQAQNEEPCSEDQTTDNNIFFRTTFPTENIFVSATVSDSSLVNCTKDSIAGSNLTYDNIDGEQENSVENMTVCHDDPPFHFSLASKNPSLSDSDSIEIPDDSFIICDEQSPKREENVVVSSENDEGNVSQFLNFNTSFDTGTNLVLDNFESHEVEQNSFTSRPNDSVLFDHHFSSETQNSDIFQPFIAVSAPLPIEKVTDSDFEKEFQLEPDEPSQKRLFDDSTTSKNENQVAEVTSVLFYPDFDAGYDDDDFSDFVSPTSIIANEKMEESERNLEEIQCNKFERMPESLSLNDDFEFGEMCSSEQDTGSIKQDTLNWTEIFSAPAEDHVEVNVNTIEGRLNCSSVWCKIKDIETSPALHYNWNDSETNKLLLCTLCVDSRNILFGPRWSSEVPRFASNLGFTPLVPQKACEKSPQNDVEFLDVTADVSIEIAPLSEPNAAVSTVPDAHFDWNNSGLTNPLDSYSHSSLLDLDLLASFDIHSPFYKKKRKPEKKNTAGCYELQSSLSILKESEAKTLSAEASNILNNLPDLIVMEKQYIVFPIR